MICLAASKGASSQLSLIGVIVGAVLGAIIAILLLLLLLRRRWRSQQPAKPHAEHACANIGPVSITYSQRHAVALESAFMFPGLAAPHSNAFYATLDQPGQSDDYDVIRDDPGNVYDMPHVDEVPQTYSVPETRQPSSRTSIGASDMSIIAVHTCDVPAESLHGFDVAPSRTVYAVQEPSYLQPVMSQYYAPTSGGYLVPASQRNTLVGAFMHVLSES